MAQSNPHNLTASVSSSVMNADEVIQDLTAMMQDVLKGINTLFNRKKDKDTQQTQQTQQTPDLTVNLSHLKQSAQCYRVDFTQTWTNFIHNAMLKYLQNAPNTFKYYANHMDETQRIPWNYGRSLRTKLKKGDTIIVIRTEKPITIRIKTNNDYYSLRRKFTKTNTILDIKQALHQERNVKIENINLHQHPQGYVLENHRTLQYYRIMDGCVCAITNITSKSKAKVAKITVNKAQFIKTSAVKKQHYTQYPTLRDYIHNGTDNKEQQNVAEYTREILSKKPSGNTSDKDTLLHILNGVANKNGKKCLFYDSSKGIRSKLTQNSYLNTVDGNDAESAKFVLTLKKLDDIEDDDMKYDKTDTILKLKESLSNNSYNKSIEDIRYKLGIAHEVDANRIIIKDIYLNGVGVAYTVSDLTENEKTKIMTETNRLQNKMKKLFVDYDKCAIHPALFHNSYDISMFDELGNKTFSDSEKGKYKVGPPGREREYVQPTGWTRYGLKVLGKYGGDKWLTPFQDPGNWYRAFHGTSREAGSSIYKGAFRSGTCNAYGKGIYCTPDISVAAGYCQSRRGIIELDTQKGRKKFYFVFQVAVNPDTMNNPAYIANFNPACEACKYWIAPTGADIRPYGILIKEV